MIVKRYFVLVTFLALVLFAVHDGHPQTAIASKDIVIAMDDSDSAKVNDPEALTARLVSGILGSLPEGSRVGFVMFAEEAKVAMPLTPVREEGIDERVKKLLKRPEYARPGIIASVEIKKGDTLWDLAQRYYGNGAKWTLIAKANNLPETGTDVPVGTVIRIPSEGARGSAVVAEEKDHKNIPAAIERSIYELKQNSRENAEGISVGKQIILITDGIIDVKDSALAVERYRWLRDELASEGGKAGIQIFSIALTERADFELMQSLAQKTNGGYYRVLKTEDIQMALNGIAGAKSLSPAPKPETVQTVQAAKTTPREAPLRPVKRKGGIPQELLILIIVGGLGVLTLAVFGLIELRKKSSGSIGRIDKSIPGAYLMDLDGITGKSNYAIDRSIIRIGRTVSEDGDIWIDESTVSGEHAQIEYRDNAFYLTDLDSTNGTFLNNEQEKLDAEVRLKAGDIISFDKFRFKFVMRGQGDFGTTQTGRHKQAGMQSNPPSEAPRASEPPSVSDAEPVESPEVVEVVGNEADDEVMSLEAYLEDQDEITGKKSLRIGKRVTRIGRDRESDICIKQNTISSAHAQIEYKDNSFYLTDLGSRNGTYLNEERARITSEVPIESDDVIYFDQCKFKFIVHGPSEKKEVHVSASSGEAVSK